MKDRRGRTRGEEKKLFLLSTSPPPSNLSFALVPTCSTNSRVNACYAAYFFLRFCICIKVCQCFCPLFTAKQTTKPVFDTILESTETNNGKSRGQYVIRLQSNLVNTDPGGSIESVRINGASVLWGLNLEKMQGLFFLRRQSKQSVIKRCTY